MNVDVDVRVVELGSGKNVRMWRLGLCLRWRLIVLVVDCIVLIVLC